MKRSRTIAGSFVCCLLSLGLARLTAQTCTTQAALQSVERDALSAQALALGLAVKQANIPVIKASSIRAFANDFDAIEYAVRNTSAKLAGDTLRVTQMYELDASTRKAGDTSEADFSCPLKGTTSEVDFAITSLPPGQYAFVMVEAAGGDTPWLLAFLLEREAGAWRMAGFYPHARTAAGRDGLWYWTAAREQVKQGKPWLAWLYFRLADDLLRPANFVTSTSLDKLRQEQRSAAPPALSDGLSPATPLVIKDAAGGEFHFTAMSIEAAVDNRSLHLVLHFAVEPVSDSKPAQDADAARSHNRAAAKAMIAAHPELRPAFTEVLVFGDTPGQDPTVLTLNMIDIK